MITFKGTIPVRWAKSYYIKSIEKAKERHKELHPDYIIEEIVEEEDLRV